MQLPDSVFCPVTKLGRLPGFLSAVIGGHRCDASSSPFVERRMSGSVDDWIPERDLFLQARLLGHISLAENECLVSSL